MKKQLKNFWDKNKYFLISVSFVITLFILWQLAVVIFKIDYFVLPKFSSVVAEFFKLFATNKFYLELGGSLSRILFALMVAVILGISLGILSVNGYIRACLRPIMATIKSLPVMAITLILLINFNKNNAPTIIGILMTLPVMYNHTTLGIDSIDKSLIEMAKVYNVSKKDTLFKIRLPQVLPSVFSGIETSGGMSVKAVVSAEILCYTVNSLGLAMHIAKSSFESQDVARLFAYALVAIILSLIIELIIKIISKGVLKWR